jgi:hydroxyacyl-ACP dehydratase HTD2-like protein with hotdog domain
VSGEQTPQTAEIRRSATAVDLFRFSAATWNAHLIHYNPERAREEGLKGPVVQAHLHGAWLWQLAESVAAPSGVVVTLKWRNLAPAYVNDVIRISAHAAAEQTPSARRYDAEARNQDDQVVATGHFTIRDEEPQA